LSNDTKVLPSSQRPSNATTPVKLLKHALLGFGSGNRPLCLLKIEQETLDNPGRVQPLELCKPASKIEEVSSFVTLEESPELGRQHFFP